MSRKPAGYPNPFTTKKGKQINRLISKVTPDGIVHLAADPSSNRSIKKADRGMIKNQIQIQWNILSKKFGRSRVNAAKKAVLTETKQHLSDEVLLARVRGRLR